MTLNPVIAMLNRRLRLAVIGGGPGSFIGAMHRQAARLDDRYTMVSGVLSSNPQHRTPNGPGTLPLAARSSRIVKGHPEGFHEGFANIYADAAEAIAARRAGQTADPLALYFPNAWDGLLGVRFVERVLASSEANGQWVTCD